MRGKPMRVDGSIGLSPFLHFPELPATGVKEREKRCGVLCASRHEAPENFDAFRLVQPLSFSAVIVSHARHLASKVSSRPGDSDLSSPGHLSLSLDADFGGADGEERARCRRRKNVAHVMSTAERFLSRLRMSVHFRRPARFKRLASLAAREISMRRSFESFCARALPPNRANSETESTFFIGQVYHCEQASHRALFHIGVFRPVMIGIYHSFPRPMCSALGESP
jgi:hypothetical protein